MSTRAKTKILLIEPSDQWITSNNGLKHWDQVMLPIGLMSLSSYLKDKAPGEVEVRILSTIVDLDEEHSLQQALQEFPADIVGIKCVIYYTRQVVEIASLVRRELPDALVVFGGPNVTATSDLVSNPALADVWVEGEGEVTFYQIVKRYQAGGREHVKATVHEVPGLLYPGSGSIQSTTRRPLVDRIDNLPYPDYEAVDLASYQRFLNYGYNRRKMAALFTSRGCPFGCIYCHVVFGKKFRSQSVERIYGEIVHLHRRYGIEDFCIVDDIFNLDVKRVKELADVLFNYGPKVRLYFPNGLRADVLTPELIDDLVRAGTIWITYSLETSSPRLQKLIKKFVKIERLKEMVEYSCASNIITNCCLMVGFPSETVTEAEESLEFFSQFKKLTIPYYFSVKYFPNTALLNVAPEFGITVNPGTYVGAYHNYAFQETPTISKSEFERLNRWYLRNVFLNEERIRNSLGILRHHFSEREICDMYSVFFRRKIEDVETDLLDCFTVHA